MLQGSSHPHTAPSRPFLLRALYFESLFARGRSVATLPASSVICKCADSCLWPKHETEQTAPEMWVTSTPMGFDISDWGGPREPCRVAEAENASRILKPCRSGKRMYVHWPRTRPGRQAWCPWTRPLF